MTRKELVKKLAEHLETTSTYLGAPTFAYQVGDYTVDRQGSIFDAGGESVTLVEVLEDRVKEEMELENTDVFEREPVFLEVGIPLEGYEGESLRNLLHLIYNNQPLIKKALELNNDLVNQEMVEALKQERMATLEHFKGAMAKTDSPYIDFDYDKETITFKLETNGEPEKMHAATQLLGLVNLAARRRKRNVTAKTKSTDNEKFTFRTWLLNLGMIGDEYKLTRKVLLQNLPGNSAFRRPVKGEVANG
jgi:hypothetical protein